MLIKNHKSEKGFALIASLLVLVLMFVLAMALVYKVNTSVKSSSNWQNSQQSFAAAEAGVEAAKRYVQSALEANTSMINSINPFNETNFSNGFPPNGCLDYNERRPNGDLKSLTIEGAAENPPVTEARLLYYFPETINGIQIPDIENDADCNNTAENFYSLYCDMEIEDSNVNDANLNNTYKDYGYSYFITFLGNWSTISKKKGEELASSSNQFTEKDYFFRVISCGIGPNARNTIETIFSVEK